MTAAGMTATEVAISKTSIFSPVAVTGWWIRRRILHRFRNLFASGLVLFLLLLGGNSLFILCLAQLMAGANATRRTSAHCMIDR